MLHGPLAVSCGEVLELILPFGVKRALATEHNLTETWRLRCLQKIRAQLRLSRRESFLVRQCQLSPSWEEFKFEALSPSSICCADAGSGQRVKGFFEYLFEVPAFRNSVVQVSDTD
jgi:hypothetical protein